MEPIGRKEHEVVMRLENRVNKAWESLVSGDVESSYKTLSGGGRLSKWQKELVSQASFLKSYSYPELEMGGDNIRHEFALVASWNFLVGKNLSYDTIQWSKLDYLTPLLGNTFELTADVNAIREVLGHSAPISPFLSSTQCYEQWPQLLSLPNLSIVTRNLFIRIIKYAQMRLGGLVDVQALGRLDSPQTKRALVNLSQSALIKTDFEANDLLPDLMMTKTMKELKQLAFDHRTDFHGTKYQIIQSIVSAVDTKTIKNWLNIESERKFIYPQLPNLPELKNYLWVVSDILEDYVNWTHQTKCLNKSETLIMDERIAKFAESTERNRYNPMEPWMPSLKDKKVRTADRIWKGKNMLLLRSIWDSDCDLILKNIVQRYAWDWKINIKDAIKNYFAGDKLSTYEKACKQNFHLVRFCEQRLEELNIEVRKPKLITCANCGIDFMDWSIDDRLSKRVGYKICFCQDCYYSAFSDWGIGNQLTDKSVMLEQLSTVANILGVVPTSSFRRNLNLATISESNQIILIKTLLSMPLQKKFVETFGSWLQSLILAGILEDGTYQTSRGVRCIAIDGHVCNSLAEKTVDDWLYSHGISHEKEPLYPYHPRLNPYKLRADWKVQNVLIEYAGLMDEPDYAAKMIAKQEIAEEFGLSLIILQPQDILNLDQKLANLADIEKNSRG